MSKRTYSTDGPQCPHCGFQFAPDEPHYYDDRYSEDECPKCELKFKVEVFTQTSWTTEPSHNETI